MRVLVPGCLLILATAAFAEAADRDKPIQVEANAGNFNDLKQIGVFTGDVRVTKGTLRVTGARLDLRRDPEGYEHAVVIASPGQLATFRQRRDPSKPGIEEIVEGSAERIEYDGKAESVKLVSRAALRRLENAEQRDELRGSVITYDSRTTVYNVEGDKSGAAGGDGRVRAIIAPRNNSGSEATPAKDEGASLKPAPSVEVPKK